MITSIILLEQLTQLNHLMKRAIKEIWICYPSYKYLLIIMMVQLKWKIIFWIMRSKYINVKIDWMPMI